MKKTSPNKKEDEVKKVFNIFMGKEGKKNPGERLLHSFDVNSVHCGAFHSFVVTKQGEIYGFGNNLRGQLGIGDFNNSKDPQLVDIPLGATDRVKSISCGAEFTYFVTEQGIAYSCGENSNFQLGLGKNREDQCFPQRLKMKQSIKMVECGDYHTIIVTQEEQIWVCGANSAGQLGLGSNKIEFPLTINRNQEFKIQEKRTTYQSISKNAKGGTIKAGGGITINIQHQGRNDTGDGRRVVQITKTRQKKVRAISCGSFHTCILFANGDLICFGRNEDGQIGVVGGRGAVVANSPTPSRPLTTGAKRRMKKKTIRGVQGGAIVSKTTFLVAIKKPLQVVGPKTLFEQNNRITHVASGWNHTILVVNNYLIWAAGLNDHGQLGLSERKRRSEFTPVNHPILNEVTNVTGLFCRDNNTVIVDDYRIMICFGESFGPLRLIEGGRSSMAMSPSPNVLQRMGGNDEGEGNSGESPKSARSNDEMKDGNESDGGGSAVQSVIEQTRGVDVSRMALMNVGNRMEFNDLAIVSTACTYNSLYYVLKPRKRRTSIVRSGGFTSQYFLSDAIDQKSKSMGMIQFMKRSTQKEIDEAMNKDKEEEKDNVFITEQEF